MTTVLAIDWSLTATGLAVWHDGTITVATVTDGDTGTKVPIEERWSMILQPVYRQLPYGNRNRWSEHERVDVAERGCLAIMEAPVLLKANGVIERIGLAAAGRLGLAWRGVPMVQASTWDVKTFATGKRSASKAEVALAIQKRFPHVDVANDNEADALSMLGMVLVKYGLDGAPQMPQDRRAVLDRIGWPAGRWLP